MFRKFPDVEWEFRQQLSTPGLRAEDFFGSSACVKNAIFGTPNAEVEMRFFSFQYLKR